MAEKVFSIITVTPKAHALIQKVVDSASWLEITANEAIYQQAYANHMQDQKALYEYIAYLEVAAGVRTLQNSNTCVIKRFD